MNNDKLNENLKNILFNKIVETLKDYFHADSIKIPEEKLTERDTKIEAFKIFCRPWLSSIEVNEIEDQAFEKYNSL